MRTIRFICLLFLLIALAPGQITHAKGNPSNMFISAPGLAKPVEITDRRTVDDLALGAIADLRQAISNPPDVGIGYDFFRYDLERGQNSAVFDRVRYFPQDDGARGYILYVGFMESDTAGGKWFSATEAGEATLRRLIDKYAPARTQAALEKVDLAAAPGNCAAGPVLDDKQPFGEPAVELMTQAYATGFTRPRNALNVALDDETEHTPYGWAHEIRLITKSYALYPLTIWGRSLDDNSPLWFEVQGRVPSTVLTLYPKKPPAPIDEHGWAYFPTRLYVPKAGCYEVEIHWGTAASIVSFAAGR
jgi:hypothetical protein